MKQLILGPAWLGDIIMSHALVQYIHKKQPESIIDILLPSPFSPIATRMSHINQCIINPLQHKELSLKKRYQLAQSIKHRYHRAYILKNSLKSALIPWWAKIPCRSSWLGEHRYGLINDIHKLQPNIHTTMVERFLLLACPKGEPLPNYREFLPKLDTNDQAQAQSIHKHKLHTKRPITILCPGAAYGPAKRWPVAHFTKLAKMRVALGEQVWVMGSSQEADLGQAIVSQLAQHGCNLCGHTSLIEAIDLISLAQAVISNDSGLMHMAAATQTPVIGLYGATSEHFAPPLSAKSACLFTSPPCRPCKKRTCRFGHYQCLTDITPAMVNQKINTLLGE